MIDHNSAEAEEVLFELHHRNYFISDLIRDKAVSYLQWAAAKLKESEGKGASLLGQKELVEAVMNSEVGESVDHMTENHAVIATRKMKLEGKKITRSSNGDGTYKITRIN